VSSFEATVSEALTAPLSGWNFGWMQGRTAVDPLPWSYADVASEFAADASSMLDMGTGGGEVLSRLNARARLTVATESWLPNVPVAASRLHPIGVRVVHVTGAPDNVDQRDTPESLPFFDSSFELVTNRHESFVAADVARVLAPGGTFVTQQVDHHSYDDLYEALGRDAPSSPPSWLPLATDQIGRAGLRIGTATAGEEVRWFHDVGALVYYLRLVPWAVTGFDITQELGSLSRLHESMLESPLRVRQRRFLVIAQKP
jgi:SAM-dependent methyltransferase